MHACLSDRARKVLQLANQEAHRFNHEFVGTEHLLLGLLKENSGVGARVLTELGLDLRSVRLEVERIGPGGPEMVKMKRLPATPRVQRAVGAAWENASELAQYEVGTGHLLLGLLCDRASAAKLVLTELGIDAAQVRLKTLALLSMRDD